MTQEEKLTALRTVEGSLLPAKEARQKKTLKQAVADVLGGTRKALGPKAISEAFPAAGCVSKSKNLSVMVGKVLSGSPEFRRMLRGKYGRRPRGAGKGSCLASKRSFLEDSGAQQGEWRR